MSKLELETGVWLLRGGKSPLTFWPSLGQRTTRIAVIDKSETVIPRVGFFYEVENGVEKKGKMLFFTDPDPYKTYHDEDEGLEPEQEQEDE